MDEQPELHVIMPVYNEDEIIVSVVNEWVQTLNGLNIQYQFSVYNDGSTDRTAEVLGNINNQWAHVNVYNKPNSGHGPTILGGYLNNDDIPWIFQVDSDNEISPEHFESLWQRREEYDFLIGKRNNRARPPARRLISFVSRLVVRMFYGAGIHDVNCPYRLMRTVFFRHCFDSLPVDCFAPNVIISGYACLKKARILEWPVSYNERQTGTVSIRKWKLLKASCQSLIQTVCVRSRFRRL